LDSGEDSQILEKNRKEKKTQHWGAKKERRKDEKLTSSDTSTTPLMMFFPLRATTCTRNIFPRNPKPPKSLATRTDPTGQNKNLNSVALAQTLNPSALLAKKLSGHS
jgi:hypothetical protein